MGGLAVLMAQSAFGETQSFNTSTGMMDVNYSGYLSRNDVVNNAPITNPIYGSQVGNGRVGAMVWNQSGINMQVSGVDTSEQSSFSAGLINFQTNPGIDSGYSKFQQRLSLYNGTLTTTYDANRTVTVFGSPNSEVIGIHVDDSRSGVTSATLDVSLWNVSSEPNNAQVANITTWQTVSTFANSTTVGISRGQADPDNFGYTLAATVQGASFTTQTVNGSDVRLNITPSSSYTIWIACSSRLNAPGNNSVTQAQTDLTNVENAGYATTLANYQSWWNTFWGKFFVQYSNSSGVADYLENMYYLYSYIIACGGYANYPFQFINGDFAANQDNSITQPKWPYGYWYWNERDCYNWCYASNHPEIMLPFNNLYNRNLSALESFTTSRFGFSGVWVPETIGWNGNANNTMNSTYVKDIYTSGTEAAQNMYNYYLYTGNQSYLSSTAYPFMRQIAIFYQNKLSLNSSNQYWISIGNSHETYWDVPDPLTDQAAVRSLFPEIIKSAQLLGQDSSLVPQWQNILNNMKPMPTDGTQYLPMDAPVAATHNDENVVAELLWPYAITGIGASDYNLELTAYNNRPFPYGNVWAPDAIQAARLGLGDSCYQGMQKMLQIYQNYPNGFTNNTNGMFEYQGVHLAAMNESLMQSQNGVIRVFPAPPSDTSFVSSFTLAAEGGFLVSSERDSNGIKYAGIDSLNGNTCNIVNPWGSTSVDVRNMATNAVVLSTSNSQFSFATSANTVYVIERTATPFSSFAHVQLTASQNNSQKVMGSNVLGEGTAGVSEGPFNGTPAAIPGTVQAENYDTGGVGVAYSVNSTNGQLTSYRSDAIDLETTSDTGGGVDLGWTSGGQWFKYTVNVATAGTYTVSFRYAAPNAVTDAFHISNSSGTNLSGNVNLATTTGWQTWGNVTANVTLPAGTQTLTIFQDNGGWNLNYVTFTSNGPAEGPFGDTPAPIPGTVQAENYDTGGQGLAYNVTSTNGTDNGYRSDGIDLEVTSDTGGGVDLGWTSAGQWYKYTVNVQTAGTYNVAFRVANGSTGNANFHLQNSSGANLTGAVTVAPTGGWQTWTTVNGSVSLPAGQQILTLWEDTGGFNINYIVFSTGGSCSASPSAPTGLGASNTTSTGTTLTWSSVTAPTNCSISNYTVYQNGTSIGTTGGTTFNVTGLSASTTYTFTIAASDSFGTGSQSPGVNVTTSAVSCSASPSAPTGLSSSNTTSSGTTINWSAVTAPANCSISSYTLFQNGTSIGTTGSTSFNVTGLSASTTYTFTVAATDSFGTGSQSAGLNVTTSSSGGGGSNVISIACGNSAVGVFVADTDFSGGAASSGTTSSINTSKVTNPAPVSVYQHGRKGTCTYTIGSLTAGTTYNVRLDFCEYVSTGTGQRTFNVSINGNQVLTNYDIFANAGGEFIANAQTFAATANSSGQIVIVFTTVVNNALVAGIEVSTTGGGTLTPVAQIDCGSPSAVSPFSADTDFNTGNEFSSTATINTSSASNPAPAAVYQTVRWNSAFTYTIPNLTPNGSYTVRLHFCELSFTAAGQRKFNVSINGTSVLSAFDIFSAAGGQFKAFSEQFSATANSTGQIAIAFTQGGADNPEVAGIEVLH